MEKKDPFALSENATCLSIKGQNTPWREVLHLGSRSVLPKGGIVPGGDNNRFHFINRGCIRLERIGRNGKERIVLFFEKESFFNEMVSIIQPMSRREQCDVSFSVLEETEIYSFRSDLLADPAFITAYPHLISNLLRSIAYKCYLFLHLATEHTLIDPTGQVCRVLYKMYLEHQRENPIVPHMSQTELGKVLGIPRSSFCRIIHSLRQEGIIGHFTRNRLEILDQDRLLALSRT